MSIESLIDDSGQLATITVEAPDGQTPGQTLLGGADRTDGQRLPVAADVPCLVNTLASDLDRSRNDGRADVIRARIYFAGDPTDSRLTTRHRIAVAVPGDPYSQVAGIYAVTGVVAPTRGADRLVWAECERVRDP